MAAIGIDLGTTNSCVAVFQHGKVEIIENDQGNKITPSTVAFTETERLIGETAKMQEASNTANTVFDAKRLIGRPFEDVFVQKSIKHWPFKVVNEAEIPTIEVKYKGETKLLVPEEISSMVLTKMKETAEAFLKTPVTKAVIGVPASFNSAQRQATKDAATIAGLNVLRLINEPTAAAIAYGLNKKTPDEKNVLIFDLGGSTLSVSVLTIVNGVFEVKSTAGDNHLGGEDFDNCLVNIFVQEFRQTHLKDLSDNKRAMRRLRTACEQAKRTLSSSTQASIQMDSLYEDIDYHTSITRARFEELCADLFRSTLSPVEKSLFDAKLAKNQIHEIVLVGGSTRIPKIQKLLREFFNSKELNMSINPDEAVAYGAAVQAAILNGDKSEIAQDLLLLDVAPFSMGIETYCWMFTELIKRNTPIPTKHTQTFTANLKNEKTVLRMIDTSNPTKDKQFFTTDDFAAQLPTLVIQVFEGERALAENKNLLGEFELTGILRAEDFPQIDVTFDINVDGILTVTAVAKITGKQSQMTINVLQSRTLTKQDIERMVKDAATYRADDEKQRARSAAKNALESYVFQVKSTIEEEAAKWRKRADEKAEEILKWLDANGRAEKEAFERQQKELESFFNTIPFKRPLE